MSSKPTQNSTPETPKSSWTIFGVASLASAAVYQFLSGTEEKKEESPESEADSHLAIVENVFETETDNTDLASLWLLISKIPYMSKPPSRQPSMDFEHSYDYSAIANSSSNLNKPIYAEIGLFCEEFLKLLLHPQLETTAIAPAKVPLAQCNVHESLTPSLIKQILLFLPIESLLAIQTIDDKYFTLANDILYNRQYLRKCARRGFSKRSIAWPWLVSDSIENFYDLYVKKLIQWRLVESGEMDEVDDLVQTLRNLQKDIRRTFSNNRIMSLSEEQQRQLQTLLGVYSLLDPDVGYVQGMNFVAGTVVFAISDELNAFSVFCQLMKLNDSPPLSFNLKAHAKPQHNGDSSENASTPRFGSPVVDSPKRHTPYEDSKFLSPTRTATRTPITPWTPLTPLTPPTLTATNTATEFKMKELPLRKILDRYDNRRKYTHSHCSGGRISKSGQRGYGLRYMFTRSLPGCVIALLQFENLLQKHMPRLYEHLCVNDINIQSFVSEWFMTLFSYVLPLMVTFRVFDLFLVDGFKALHRIGLAILSRAKNHLMVLEDDAILMYLKQFPDSGIFLNPDDEEDGDTFIEHALSFKMTNSELHLICTDLLAKTMAHNADNNSYAVFSKTHKR